MQIGTIVSSRSHTLYTCRILGRGEAAEAFSPADHALGTLVGMRLEDVTLVAILTDTQLYNPDYGSRSPRITQPDALAVFAPDYLDELATLVELTVIGSLAEDGSAQQGCASLAASIGTVVSTLSEAEFDTFHTASGSLRIAYLPGLLANPQPQMLQVLTRLLAVLAERYPDEAPSLQLLADDIAWRASICPLEARL